MGRSYVRSLIYAAVGSVRHRRPVSIGTRRYSKRWIEWRLSVTTIACSRPIPAGQA